MCAGWLNVLGQLALTASTAFLVAIHLSVMFLASNGHQLATFELFLTYASTHSQGASMNLVVYVSQAKSGDPGPIGSKISC